MEPSHQRPQGGQDRRNGDGLSSQTVHDLQGALTIIKAQAQMLRRWALRHDVADVEAVLTRLAAIDDTTTHLSIEIDRLRRPDSSNPQADERADRP